MEIRDKARRKLSIVSWSPGITVALKTTDGKRKHRIIRNRSTITLPTPTAYRGEYAPDCLGAFPESLSDRFDIKAWARLTSEQKDIERQKYKKAKREYNGKCPARAKKCLFEISENERAQEIEGGANPSFCYRLSQIPQSKQDINFLVEPDEEIRFGGSGEKIDDLHSMMKMVYENQRIIWFGNKMFIAQEPESMARERDTTTGAYRYPNGAGKDADDLANPGDLSKNATLIALATDLIPDSLSGSTVAQTHPFILEPGDETRFDASYQAEYAILVLNGEVTAKIARPGMKIEPKGEWIKPGPEKAIMFDGPCPVILSNPIDRDSYVLVVRTALIEESDAATEYGEPETGLSFDALGRVETLSSILPEQDTGEDSPEQYLEEEDEAIVELEESDGTSEDTILDSIEAQEHIADVSAKFGISKEEAIAVIEQEYIETSHAKTHYIPTIKSLSISAIANVFSDLDNVIPRDTNEMLTRWKKETAEKIPVREWKIRTKLRTLINNLSGGLNSPYCGIGYSTPPVAWSRIRQEKESDLAEAATSRTELAEILHREARSISSMKKLAGFRERLYAMNQHDKKIVNDWSEIPKKNPDGTYQKTPFEIAREARKTELELLGTMKSKIKKILYREFDRKGSRVRPNRVYLMECQNDDCNLPRQEYSVPGKEGRGVGKIFTKTTTPEEAEHIACPSCKYGCSAENVKIITSVLANKAAGKTKVTQDSLWHQKKSQAMKELHLKKEHWNLIYSQLPIQQARIQGMLPNDKGAFESNPELDEKFIERRVAAGTLLKEALYECETVEDLQSYKQWAYKQEYNMSENKWDKGSITKPALMDCLTFADERRFMVVWRKMLQKAIKTNPKKKKK